MSEWQSIETAPTNARCLVFGELDDERGQFDTFLVDQVHRGLDSRGRRRFFADIGYANGEPAVGRATHWMPLPEPPKPSK